MGLDSVRRVGDGEPLRRPILALRHSISINTEKHKLAFIVFNLRVKTDELKQRCVPSVMEESLTLCRHGNLLNVIYFPPALLAQEGNI